MKRAARVALIAVIMLLIIAVPAQAYMIAADNHSSGIVKVSGDIYVNEGTTVDGDVVSVLGNIYINGSVSGNAVTVLGDIIVNGKVQGDATTVQGKITVGQNGKILGNTVEALGGSNFTNKWVGFRPNINIPFFLGIGNIVFSLVFSLIALLLTALIYLIMPAKIDEMANTIDSRMGKRIGIGFLALIGSPIIMVLLSILLTITIVGIIVIPFLWMAYMAAGLVALVPVYIYIGTRAVEIFGKRKISGYGAIAAGILSVWLIKAILSFGGAFTGWMNAIISMLVFVLGTGTLLDYIFTKRKPDPIYESYPPQGGGLYKVVSDVPKDTVPEAGQDSVIGDESSDSKNISKDGGIS